MRSIITCFVLAFVGLSSRASAQANHFYRKLDFAPLVQRTVIDLFAGIPTDSARNAAARDIVAQSTRAQWSLAPMDSDYSVKLLALMEHRNSSLLSLLDSRADSVRFSTNEQTVDSYWRAHLKPAAQQRP